MMETREIYTVFLSRVDGANLPFVHYDDEKAAIAHQDRINASANEHRRKVLGCNGAFIRHSSSAVRKHFPAMDKGGLRTLASMRLGVQLGVQLATKGKK